MYEVTIINIPQCPRKIGLRTERDFVMPLPFLRVTSKSFQLDTLGVPAENGRGQQSRTCDVAAILACP